MASLTLQDVRKSYGGLQILKGIDLTVDDGDFLVLVGPSGCGKSTLLSIIAGLDTPTAGDILIGGQRVNDKHPKDRDIAMVFQSYALYPTMKVADNITFGLEMRGASKVDRRAALDRVAKMLKIEHLLDRKPSQLSGGQRQRVAMGRALVRNPAIFLFDEPLSNLDAKLRLEMRTEIKRLHQATGTTAVYVTHDQIEAMTLATKIAVMKDGALQQFADPQTVYDTPANMFVAGFIGAPAMNFIPARLDGDAAVVNTSEGAARLALGDKARAASGYQGKDIILGIRPEAITAATNGRPSALRARVEILEPTGPDTMTMITLGGAETIARVHPKDARPVGQAMDFAVDMSKANLFDPKTEQRI